MGFVMNVERKVNSLEEHIAKGSYIEIKGSQAMELTTYYLLICYIKQDAIKHGKEKGFCINTLILSEFEEVAPRLYESIKKIDDLKDWFFQFIENVFAQIASLHSLLDTFREKAAANRKRLQKEGRSSFKLLHVTVTFIENKASIAI